MHATRCNCGCGTGCVLTRRGFLRSMGSAVAGASLFGGCSGLWRPRAAIRSSRPCGPASQYVPRLKAAFVRRREEYGMWWPGAVYDGQAARRRYTAQLIETAESTGVTLDLRPEPIYSLDQAETWLVEAKAENVDGLIVMVHDRQKHSWPTAYKAAESGIPAVIFSPLGTSFTTNTMQLADKPGCVVYSTDDFVQAAYGIKMLAAGSKMRRARCVVLKGTETYDKPMADLGITLRHIPAATFLDDYNKMPITHEIRKMAEDYLRRARRQRGATRQDVINGVKSYFVARQIIKREEADAITMDCLGAIGKTGSAVSLPCIAWSRMNDEGIPAACEADYGAVASHMAVQYLFDRPGFQQDPVADTAENAIIGAHCSCPTRLNGFDQPPEPFDLTHHHGNRDAVPRTLWRIGQPVTSIDVLPPRARFNEDGRKTKVLVSTGTVLANMSVPPSGGCVVSVKVNFDGGQDVLSFPGFHQVFFYGDYKQQMLDFCKLFDLQAQAV